MLHEHILPMGTKKVINVTNTILDILEVVDREKNSVCPGSTKKDMNGLPQSCSTKTAGVMNQMNYNSWDGMLSTRSTNQTMALVIHFNKQSLPVLTGGQSLVRRAYPYPSTYLGSCTVSARANDLPIALQLTSTEMMMDNCLLLVVSSGVNVSSISLRLLLRAPGELRQPVSTSI